MNQQPTGAPVSGDHNLYSSTQQSVLSYLSVGTGFLSVLGSLYFANGIISDHRKGARMGPLQHFQLGLAFTNFIFSLGLCVFGPWAMPIEAGDYVAGATGNWRSCYAAGFFFQFFIGSAWYWFSLALYYVMMLQFQWSAGRFANYLEPFCHMFVVLATLLEGSVSIYYDYYVPLYTLPGFCFIAKYPPECNRDDPQAVECTRGEPKGFYFSSLLWKWGLLFVYCAMIVATVIIMFTVKQMDPHRIRAREVGFEGLGYIAVFFIVYTPAIAMYLAGFYPKSTSSKRIAYFVIAVITNILSPMGGFLTTLVFVGQRFKPIQYQTPS